MQADFFALEKLLIDRLTGIVQFNGQPVDVKSIRQITQRDANNELLLPRVPALLVVYDGYRVLESSGLKVRLGQGWSVTAAVANLRDSDGVGARDDATPLLDQVFTRLQGWVPPAVGSSAFKPLSLANPVYEPFFGTRNSYFPLSFTSERPLQVPRT